MAKVVTFGGFKRRATSFRVAGVALRDSSTVGNVLPATTAHILFDIRTLQKMVQDFLVALYLAYVPTCYLLRLLRFYPLVN